MRSSVTRPFSLAAMALALLPLRAGAVEIQVVTSGKYAGSLEAYQAGEAVYLGAKEAGAAYGAQVYWYPVAGRVQLSVRGRQAQLLVNSEEARVGEKTVRLPRPVIVRASRAFVPIEFFLSPEFSELAAADSQFNARTRLLTVDRRVTVGPLRWFSYRDYTRIVLEIGPGLTWSSARHGRSGFDVTVPLGRIEWSEDVSVEDGLADSLRLRQEARLARLSVRLEGPGVQWEVRERADPRRLVIDVFSDPKAMAAERRAAAAEDAPRASIPASAPVPAEGAAVPPAAGSAPAPPAAPEGPRKERYRIVVDAGHGGKDSGTSGRRGTQEKDLNLLAARELAALLKEEGSLDVMLTREDDTFVPLDDRSRKANEFQADLFVSLHCNASSSRSENGFEIYFLSEQASDPESQRVADMENAALQLEGRSAEEAEAASLLHAMAKTEFINDASELAGLMSQQLAKRVDLQRRGVKQAAFYVLRGTDAPAVLVEMGFLTNSRDEAKLESRKFRRRVVEGLYAGVVDFAKRRGWSAGRSSR